MANKYKRRILFIAASNCRFGEFALKNYETEALRTKNCLSFDKRKS